MGTERAFRPVVRFGPFEVDFAGRELLKSGARVKLQEQQFHLLSALLERPGEVLTREELRQRIWPADTFVDFERGLNKAVNRLREALDDPAESPRFIETVPRRGYRFIADVRQRVGSLAVLPLENLSGDRSQEYWAEGLTEELITHIARIAGLRVISKTSAMQFKGTSKPLADIARALSVDAVIQGSIVVSDRVRIRVQLVDPFRDQYLWTESYERELSDILSLQTEIAQAVCDQIEARFTAAGEASSKAKPRVNPEAYEAYLKGRYFLSKGTGVERSLEYFNKAITVDPAYAVPYAGLADCYILLGVLYLRRPREVFPKAKEFAVKALERDAAIAEAHKSLAVVEHLYDWDWAGSEQEFRRALELDRSQSDAHRAFAILLSCVRRYEEAIEEALLARALDPLSPNMNALLGFIYMRARQYERAIQACREAIELDASSPFAHWLLARSLDAADRTREALVEAEAAAKLSGNRSPYATHLGYALARAGDPAGARKLVESLREREKSEYVSPYEFVTIYVALGETDSAFEYLEKAYQERTSRLAGELWDRPFDGLRSDPRFQDLIRRIGLPS